MLSDPEIREKFHQKILRRQHRNHQVRVIDELGLRHGACRADIAVIGGELRGFEIKGDRDSLSRLLNQVENYSAVFDRATAITVARHAESVIRLLPNWWGIIICERGMRGGISFETERSALRNPDVDPLALTELLWRSEAQAILRDRGIDGSILNRPRRTLYRRLAAELSLGELHREVRKTLVNREKWRDPVRQPLSYGDSFRHCAK